MTHQSINLFSDAHAAILAFELLFGNAEVSGDARVFVNAEVSGDARVFGNARVFGDARVFGNAEVSGDARVFGNARVFGDARVSLSVHIGWFSSVGSEAGTLTYFHQKDGSIYTNRGCFSGTLDEFESAVGRRHGDSRIGREYDLLIQFIRLRASAWEVAQQEAA
nr:polymer-forming cytoskeletal protein [Acetobacter malorum]